MTGTFLIASKNRSTEGSLQQVLKEEGHTIIVTRDGHAVVDYALDKKPNAIFLGVMLGGLDGLDIARALRGLTPTETIPIIFLAENQHEAKLVTEAHLPLTDCLSAPYDLDQVKLYAAAGLHTGEHVATIRTSHIVNHWMMSLLDPLTRLYHRRYLLHLLAYEAKRCARYHTPLSVLLVDVDNLKEINRKFGILMGDTVLIELGQILLKMMRGSELVGRNDVQDFLILAPHTNESGALTLANRICSSIAEHHFILEKLDLHVTVSVGVASSLNFDLAENLALLGRAESALINAKHAGKNRVETG